MPDALRDRFEERFQADLSGVRLHLGDAAAAAARALSARAYTVGSHIVFGAGTYAPDTPAGARLLAHELAHAQQQRHAQVASPLSIGPAGDAFEREAEAAAEAATSGREPPGRGRRPPR